eukprot:Plantae.Rhodophyta-Palmaria_palmata.ctg17116.p1 GENE.Plantae.Rhodophyta-Palmaria_palmata.ctg17116~~Plantae.Rhodophyta-Palmaria_palmata.ctg17116.p1  ORF type:complete len:253 (-),score=34.37 Plantae.Rhodophyta-Palmaria_palmata.ctg17116:57-782(-)
MFTGVHYYTGQLFELEKITKAAHEQGCMVGFDLAHAVGNAEIFLHEWGVDFAVWCSYKYLNSGPGGIAGAFVHEKHHGNKRLQRLAGWWGQKWETRFDMLQPFDPIEGADGFRLSNPPLLQVVSLIASLEIFEKAGGMSKLRAKSLRLTGYLEHLIRSEFAEGMVEIITPSDPKQRGCQLTLTFSVPVDAFTETMLKAGCICDFRKPNGMRIAPTPLYNTFEDVFKFVSIVKKCLMEEKGE